MNARAVVLCLLCLLLLSTPACHSDRPAHTLVFAVAQSPLNLDPRDAADAASERANRLLYQRLVEFDAAFHVVPSMADWQQLDDLHYLFKLRPAQRPFHHGMPLTARDVQATYLSLLQRPSSPHCAEFSHVAAVTIPEPQSVLFSLSRPDPHFVERLMMGVLPADLIAAGHDFSHHPVGNGPFAFESWDSSLQMRRLHDGLHVRFEEVKDPTVRVLKLKRGEVDLLQGDLPPELVRYLQSQPNVVVNTGRGANLSYIGVNAQAPFLQDVRVRQALAYAMDVKATLQHVLVPHSRPGGALLPPEHYAGNGALPDYGYQPARARQLLQSAGVVLPLTLTYKTSTDPQRVRLATIMQAQMRAAGIDLQIVSLDWGTFFSDVQQGHVQLYGLTWVGMRSPEIYQKVLGSQHFPPQGLNRGRYQDAVLDTLLAHEDWLAVTTRVHQQLPYIPLWYEGQFVAHRTRLHQYQPAMDGNWDGLVNVVLDPAA